MTESRLLAAARALVRELVGARLDYLGVYSYRVSEMVAERANLTALDTSRGLPDTLSLLSEWCGVSGAWSKLSVGCDVLIAFADGDPARPVIVGFAPKGSSNAVPEETEIDATDELRLGESVGTAVILAGGDQHVARVGDACDAGTWVVQNTVSPPAPAGVVFTYTPPGGTPVSFILVGAVTVQATPTTVPLSAEIIEGNPKVLA